MNFGEVLSRAWQIIWRNKVLWIFGILAGCGNATGSGGGNTGFRFSEGDRLPPQLEQFFSQFERLPDWQIALLVGLVVLAILVLIVLFVLLGTIGRVGLIRGTQMAERGDTTLLFGDLFREGMRYFWRVFLLNLLFGLAFAVVIGLIVIAYIGVSIVTLGIGALCLLPFICLLVPLGWFLQVVVEQANVALVVEDLGILDGFRRGWDVVRTNLGPIIVMSLILLLGIGLLGGLIIGIPLAAVIGPAVTGAIIGTDRALGGGLLIAALCFVAYLPVLILLNGILRGYIISAWTLTYMRLTSRPAAIEPAPVPG